jgi:hypothetical protein
MSAIIETTQVTEHWRNNILGNVDGVIVRRRPTKAERDGFDGRIKVVTKTGHYQMVANLVANATLACDVRIRAKHNQLRLFGAKRVLTELGIHHESGYRSVVVGAVRRSQLEAIAAQLAAL